MTVQQLVTTTLGNSDWSQWSAALWFALAVLLMDRFDISLPRGDSIGVSGALVAAGAMVAGLVPISILSLVALVLAHAGRTGQGSRLRGALLTRAVALLFMWVVYPLWVRTEGQGIVWLVCIPAVYLCAEVFAAQAYMSWESGRPLRRLLVGNYRRQAPLVAAQVSAAVLAVITYPDMQAWSLVLVVALLLLMRQSLALLLEIRETYRTTVEVLVEVAERQDERRRGHGERTAHIAREIAMHMGLNASDVERVSYASLLHDLGALAEQNAEENRSSTGQSAQVFQGTAFFDDVLPVLRLCDGTGLDADYTDGFLTSAMLVALASDVDASANESAAAAHTGSAVARVAAVVPQPVKARVVSAAIELGYRTPAVL